MPQVLHNICSLAFIESRLLRHVSLIHGHGIMLNFWRNFQKLPLVGLASCEVTSKVENRSKLYTTSLSALLSEHFDPRERHLAFLATCVNGDRYLIGLNEPPYPIVNTSDSLPGKPSDQSGCNITVEYTDTLGLLPVLD